jgi:hypothetical protein
LKPLLLVSVVVEASTGLGLLVAPSALAQLLIGAPLEAPAAVTIAHACGTALLALALACWLARENGRAMVVTMLFYNLAVAAVLAHAALGLGLSGVGLWPAVGLHIALAVWCAVAPKSTVAH